MRRGGKCQKDTILLSASTASSSRIWRRFASGNSAAISVCSASLVACIKAALGAVLGRLCCDFSVQRQLVGLSCLRQFLYLCTSKASDFSVEWQLVGLSSASVLELLYQ